MYKQDKDFANYDGSRVSLISRLRKQVLAVPAPLLCSLLFAAALALMPISAEAQCSTGWDASGEWSIKQRGSKYTNRLTLVQKNRVITGDAITSIDIKGGFLDPGGRDPLGGTVDGTIDGDSLSIQIFWANGLTGVYNGKVLPSGRLDGEAWEKASPNIRQTWYSVGVLKCAPPPPVTPKVIKSSGKAKPAPPKPPFINAGQPITKPHLPFASVYVGWDGGPDHPDVEVFVSIDNGVETPAFSMDLPPQHPVFKQPKVAAIELKLQRGRHYKFVLKGAGKTLSTAAFVVP